MNFNGEILNDFIAFTKHANEIAPMVNTQVTPVQTGQMPPRMPIMGTEAPKALMSASPTPATNTDKGIR